MKPIVYVLVQAELADMALRLRGLRLEEFIQAAEHADTLGALMDPTLYRQAGPRLGMVLAMAQAAKAFRDTTATFPAGWLEGLGAVLREGEPTCADAGGLEERAARLACEVGEHPLSPRAALEEGAGIRREPEAPAGPGGGAG